MKDFWHILVYHKISTFFVDLDEKVIEVKLKKAINFANAKGIKILKEKDKNFSIEIDTNQTDLTTVLNLINPENIVDINISNTPLEEIISSIYTRKTPGKMSR